MNILAVIPARAGSKGIPNKNIRLVGGKPLIWYSINNAKKSKYITDVVISTDSPEIYIIANQTGVKLHKRSAALCGDSVTLDAVIYDAFKSSGKEYDYVVTMQPTSPTLKTETLDSAIEKCINDNNDTVISVINKPHLSWTKTSDNKIVPNYTERLNRQYLPPCYMETGAFVISKAEVVTPNSRIGKDVSVFEISENESVDIDSFLDLQAVNSILKQQNVAMYVNGNTQRGLGHVYRALELADEFYVNPDIYYDINQTDRKVFGTTTHNLIGINSIGELLSILNEKKYNIFINDILSTNIDYMIALRHANPDCKIVNFEDDSEGTNEADLVFNALFNNSANKPNVYSGEQYYIAPKMFLFYEPIAIKEHVENVLITFGGADPQNYTDRLLKIITSGGYEKYKFYVILGKSKQNVETLLKYNNGKNINVLFDIKNMPEIISKCDIALTSRGRTVYELGILGVPSIVMSQNEREQQHGFACHENGYNYLGLNPSDSIIKSNLDMYLELSKEDRQQFQSLMLKHNLKIGRQNVMNLINTLA